MDINENDLIMTNKFIRTPDTTSELSNSMNDEFRKYYEREQQQKEEQRLRDSLDRVSIRSINLDEDTDANSMLNTHRYESPHIAYKGMDQTSKKSVEGALNINRYKKEIKTYVSVDSRDRDKQIYTKPNFFKIFLGKTFYNVKSIKLASIEFPNTSAVINSSNNKIYWRNKEDFDDVIINNQTGTYPVYSVDLRIGSYISTSLRTEMTNKLATIKRRDGQGNYHYFQVTLDIDTDIVTFTSLILKPLDNNPFKVVVGETLITVTALSHGFKNDDIVYIVGSKSLAGIPSDTINQPHKVIYVDADKFKIEVNIIAGETVLAGGGNVVKLGTKAPFQLIFGDYNSTIAPNIGFPMENSSQRIDTYIKAMRNLYQIRLTFSQQYGWNNRPDIIGQTVELIGFERLSNGLMVPAEVNGNHRITGIVDEYSLLLEVDERLSYVLSTMGEMTFLGETYSYVTNLDNNDVDTILVRTFTNHNYKQQDIKNAYVTFYNSGSNPSYDRSNLVYGILSPTELIIPGSLFSEGGFTDILEEQRGSKGSFPIHNPLKTYTMSVIDIIPGYPTTFKVDQIYDSFRVGDTVRFFNVFTIPSLYDNKTGVYTVMTIDEANKLFTIDYSTTSFDPTSISNGTAVVGTQIVSLYFPYHGFNTITEMTNYTNDFSITSIVDVSTVSINKIRVTTSIPHLFENGDRVRISGSNSIPSINGTDYEVSNVLPTSFEMVLPFGLTASGSSGAVNFYPRRVKVTTRFDHNLVNGQRIKIMETNCIPRLGVVRDNGFEVVIPNTVGFSEFEFLIKTDVILTQSGDSGIIGMDQEFQLYGVEKISDLPLEIFNGQKYSVRDITDPHNLRFISNAHAPFGQEGGGPNVYINSLYHGFNSIQTNTKNNILNRSINLEGENYAFLCCPQLSTMMNTGRVSNVFARITLDQSPGNIVFSFLSNPKMFDTVPLDLLSELEFSIVNHDGTLYDFNDLDFSFCLEITEVIDTTDTFNISSKRGVGNLQ
jgi:hypothetical protein